MRKMTLLAALLVSCTSPEEPGTKKASFVLKEACKGGGIAWNPKPPPVMWNAFYVRDTARSSIDLRYNNGFWYLCSTEDPGTLEVFYQ
jgi:hypothetical protein